MQRATELSVEQVNKSPRQPQIHGIEINMGGYKWTMPAMSMRHMKVYADKEKEIRRRCKDDEDAEQKAYMEASLEAACAALQRNYPSMTLDMLLDLVDASNLSEVMDAMKGASGLVGKQTGASNQT